VRVPATCEQCSCTYLRKEARQRFCSKRCGARSAARKRGMPTGARAGRLSREDSARVDRILNNLYPVLLARFMSDSYSSGPGFSFIHG
jgi:hypothetical protein